MPQRTRSSRPSSVLLLAGEDDADTTLRPRLEAMGANVRRVLVHDKQMQAADPIVLPDGTETLAASIRNNRIRLVVIDPVDPFIAGSGYDGLIEIERRHGYNASMSIPYRFALSFVAILLLHGSTRAQDRQQDATSPFLTGNFRWRSSEPLLEVNPERLPPSPDNPWHAVKDPSVVHYQDRWHLFCTFRKRNGGDGKPPGYIRMGHISFADWKDASDAQWHLLEMSMGYHGAPQVFYFTPHRKWYLIYQLEDATRDIAFGPCYSTTEDINDPTSWSLPTPLYSTKPDNLKGWLDFWVICDEEQYTSVTGIQNDELLPCLPFQ